MSKYACPGKTQFSPSFFCGTSSHSSEKLLALIQVLLKIKAEYW
jgi:hypothetical protein